MRLQLSLCLALLALAGDALAQAPRKGGYLRASVELRARSAAEVERVETVTTDIRQTRAEHRPVSDLMLRLSADGGAIDTALQTANAVAGAKSSPLFRAELYIVVAGRIVRDANATCARWVDDMAVCRMDCDGGAFALRRRGREYSAGSRVEAHGPRVRRHAHKLQAATQHGWLQRSHRDRHHPRR